MFKAFCAVVGQPRDEVGIDIVKAAATSKLKRAVKILNAVFSADFPESIGVERLGINADPVNVIFF